MECFGQACSVKMWESSRIETGLRTERQKVSAISSNEPLNPGDKRRLERHVGAMSGLGADACACQAEAQSLTQACLTCAGNSADCGERLANLIKKLRQIETHIRAGGSCDTALARSVLDEVESALKAAWLTGAAALPAQDGTGGGALAGGAASKPSSREAQSPKGWPDPSEQENGHEVTSGEPVADRPAAGGFGRDGTPSPARGMPEDVCRLATGADLAADMPAGQSPNPFNRLDRLAKQLTVSLAGLAPQSALPPGEPGSPATAYAGSPPAGESGQSEAGARWFEPTNRPFPCCSAPRESEEPAVPEALLQAGTGTEPRPFSSERAAVPQRLPSAKLNTRLARIEQKFSLLAAIERSVGEMAARLEDVQQILLDRKAPPASAFPDALDHAFQDIQCELAGLRAFQERMARQLEHALNEITDWLPQIAGCRQARDEVPSGRDEPRGAGVEREPTDPFVPVLKRLREEGESAALGMNRRSSAAKEAARGTDTRPPKPNQGKLEAYLPAAGSSVGMDGFLIEPGSGHQFLGAIGASNELDDPTKGDPTKKEENKGVAPPNRKIISGGSAPACKAGLEPRTAQARDDKKGRFRPLFRRLYQRRPAFRGRRSTPVNQEARLFPGAARQWREELAYGWKSAREIFIVASVLAAAAIGAYALERTILSSNADGLAPRKPRQIGGTDGEPITPEHELAAAPFSKRRAPQALPEDRLRPEVKLKDEPAPRTLGNARYASGTETDRFDPFALPQPIVPAGGVKSRGPVMAPISGSVAIVAQDLQPAGEKRLSALPLPQAAIEPQPARTSMATRHLSPELGNGLRPQGAAATSPAAAREILLARAESGDREAQFELAQAYADGSAGPRDYQLAAQWYAKAAEQGQPIAQYRLASLYEKGVGVKLDLDRAKDLYLQSAESGNVRAMHNLGVLVAEGSGGKPNYKGAAVWFSKAAEYGVRDSQYNLAVLLARGLGVPKDLVKSYTWFAIVAAAGDEDAGRKRDEVGARLTSSELAAARTVAAAFVAIPADPAANESPALAGVPQPLPQQMAPAPPVATARASLHGP